MLVDGTIKTPLAHGVRRGLLWTLGWFLSLEQFLEVDPFALSLRQKRSSRLRREVSDDDAVSTCQRLPGAATKATYLMNRVKTTTPPSRLKITKKMALA